MLGQALRYPLKRRESRTATAWSIAVVLTVFVLASLATDLWPSWTVILPALLVVPSSVLFVAHLTELLSATGTNDPDPIPFHVTRSRVRLGLRTLTIAFCYLLVPGLLLAVGGYLIATESIPTGAVGLAASIIATVSLLVVVAFTYFLPGGVTVGAQRGIRAALKRSAVSGLASASYFVSWTGSTVFVVLAWGAISVTAPGTVAGVLAVGWFTYTHLVAARLLGIGLQRVQQNEP